LFRESLEGRKEGDELLDWVKRDAIRKTLLFDEASNADLVRKVVREGYANDLTDDELEKIGRDPFLISHGLSDGNRCIVTTEVSKLREYGTIGIYQLLRSVGPEQTSRIQNWLEDLIRLPDNATVQSMNPLLFCNHVR
jgi:hypothetical protein